MKGTFGFINLAAAVCMVTMPALTYAGAEAPSQFDTPSSRLYTRDIQSYVLALNADDTRKTQMNAASSANSTPYEAPLWTASNAHKYMGLGTVALVAATALAPKPKECEGGSCDTSGPHQTLARAAAAMAAATVVSGLVVHWNDFFLEDGLTDPDNLHAMLGTAGALLMLAAVSRAPAWDHSVEGIAGGVAMGAAIKITW